VNRRDHAITVLTEVIEFAWSERDEKYTHSDAYEALDVLRELTAPPLQLVMPYPLRKDYLAQVVVPRTLTREEAQRLCAFVQSLVQPSEDRNDE
jgi:hypothetical protein